MVNPKYSDVRRLASSLTRQLVLLVLTALLPAALSPLLAQDDLAPQKKVLVFHLMRPDDAAAVANERVYQNVLTDGLAGQIDYYSEHVDLARFGVKDYQSALRNYLRQKYKGTQFDLIIATTTDLRDFLVRYGAEVFPQTPVVFSVGGETPDDRAVPSNFTGIVYDTDRRGTLDVIHTLQPAVKRIVVISGASQAVDKWHEARARKQFDGYRDRFEFVYLSGLPMGELKHRVSSLGKESVIYFLMMAEDGAGQRFSTVDALDQIASTSSVPIYTWHDSYLGHGVVGGKLASSENVANKTAQLALRVLRGEPIESIPVSRADTSRLAFDWRQLQRWNLDEKNLPAGSEVLFKEATLWERYRSRIIGVIGLVALQSALIVALLVERRRRRKATLKLEGSEARYRNVVETQTELICRFLPDTTLTFVNDAYCKYFGKTADELIGTKLVLLIPESDRAVLLRHVESLIRQPRNETQEYPAIRADGSHGWQQWTHTVISSWIDAAVELQGVGRDISERKQLEQQLIRSERQYSTLVKNSPDVICRLDRELRFTYCSPNFDLLFGLPDHVFLGKQASEVAVPDYDWKGFEYMCRWAVEKVQATVHEFQYRERYYRTRIIPEYPPGGEVESVIMITEDVTERQLAELELQRLTTRLFTLQDEERRRIARELHDGAAQNISAIMLNLHRIENLPADQIPKRNELIADTRHLAQQSLAELRTLSYLLHPPVLDQFGLDGALQWFAKGFSERSGIQIETDAVHDIGRLPLEVETALFRIVQESLTNVRRHSGSDTATIELERHNGEVRLQILDRGHGMLESANGPISANTELGVGIPGMRQRLVQLGGRLEIQSSNKGTRITAVVPISGGEAVARYTE